MKNECMKNMEPRRRNKQQELSLYEMKQSKVNADTYSNRTVKLHQNLGFSVAAHVLVRPHVFDEFLLPLRLSSLRAE